MVTGTQIRDAFVKAMSIPGWQLLLKQQQWDKIAELINEQSPQEDRIAQLEARVEVLESSEGGDYVNKWVGLT